MQKKMNQPEGTAIHTAKENDKGVKIQIDDPNDQRYDNLKDRKDRNQKVRMFP
jgi:hypothetical protein